MPTIDLGRLRIFPRGAYSGATQYQFLDLVSFEGSTWIFTNMTPATGISPPTAAQLAGGTTTNTHWALNANGAAPLTADGDMLIRQGGAIARLPVGANGQFLRVNGGLPSWGIAPTRTGQNVLLMPDNGMMRTMMSGAAIYAMDDGTLKVLGIGGGGAQTFNPGNWNTVTPFTVPVERGGLATPVNPTLPWVQVVSRFGSHFALDSAGVVWSGGMNANGQLGHGDTTNRAFMQRIQFFVDQGISISAIRVPHGWGASTSQDNVFFITTTGQVWACGQNGVGQLGDGSTTNRSTPVRCGLITGVTNLVTQGCDSQSVYAWTAGGQLWSWGGNAYGQLGLGDTTNRNTPVATSITNCARVACAGGFISTTYTFAYAHVVTSAGAMFACGYNGYGQLGTGDTTNRSAWTQVGIGRTWTDVISNTGGYGSTYALDNTGRILATGYNNSHGNLGMGDVVDRTSFVEPTAGTPTAFQGQVSQIYSAGYSSTVSAWLVTTDGYIWGVGNDGQGELGQNNPSYAGVNNTWRRARLPWTPTPGYITRLFPYWSSSNGVVLNILTSDGKVWACGRHNEGQLARDGALAGPFGNIQEMRF